MKKTKDEKIKLAFSFLDRGWSILPCGLDKRPLLSWKIWQTEYPSRETVKAWFEQFPEAQIGIITGKLSNLTVVDCEKGADPSILPQNTTIVKTGGEGYHYLYLYEDGVTNKARIRELTDLRSEGGYIVAMGSMSSKGEYVLLQDKPLLSFPKHLFPDKVNIFEATQSTNHRFETKELETYAGVGKGSRNDSLSRYIGYLLTQIHPSSWETEARQLIENANRANNPPLSPRELETTFNSIKQIEIRNNPLGRGNNFEQTNYQEPV
ncbi:MAG: bifunctional DNA primase/polymerase, partial [Candidatus Omnitrophica bacterium]|nr:bifunctional DNA primase/polymerase [Candidatus Omnitrophota bacterium]